MLLCFGLLLVLSGLAIMAFGLLLFYAWLPLFYGLFGLDIGLLLGRWLTGEAGLFAIILGIASAVALAGAAYVLQPYHRILLGLSAGALLSLPLTHLLGLDGLIAVFFGTILAVGGGLIGAMIVPKLFDAIIIAASAFGGAVIVMVGAHFLLPGVSLFDHAAGSFLPALITIVLTVVGMSWQFTNIATWNRYQPRLDDVSNAANRNQSGSRTP